MLGPGATSYMRLRPSHSIYYCTDNNTNSMNHVDIVMISYYNCMNILLSYLNDIMAFIHLVKTNSRIRTNNIDSLKLLILNPILSLKGLVSRAVK